MVHKIRHRKLTIGLATPTTLKISGELGMENDIIGKSKLIDMRKSLCENKNPPKRFFHELVENDMFVSNK